MSYHILSAAPAHCAVLSRLHGLCFAAPWDEESFARLLAMPGAFAFLASPQIAKDAAPVGYALALAGGGECEIITLGVRPDDRARGAGATLVDAVTVRAGELGANDLVLEVADDNLAAIALYRSAGFAPVGRRAGYYGDGAHTPADTIVMRRVRHGEKH